MHQQVYSHRARLITDAMIVRGLRLAVETDEQMREAYTYGSRKQLERYLALDDDRLDATILDGPDARAASIYARLRNRRLYKQVSVIYLDERGVTADVSASGRWRNARP